MSGHYKQLQSIIDCMKTDPEVLELTTQYGKQSPPKNKDERFNILIHLVVGARCREESTDKAMSTLGKIDGGITASNLSTKSINTIQNLIKNVPFNKTKAERIKKISEICSTKYDGDIPKSDTELMDLPGVGVKSATLASSYCWGTPTGIGVDTHIHRVSNRLGWVKTKEPNETEVALREAFDSSQWEALNASVLAFGKHICTARRPCCNDCPLKDTCMHIGVRKKKESEFSDEEEKEEKE